MHEHALRPRGVERAVAERERVGVAGPELHRQPARHEARRCPLDHRRALVDADHVAARRHQLGEDARVEPDAAPDVEHAVPGADAGRLGTRAVELADALVGADALQVSGEGLRRARAIDVLEAARDEPVCHLAAR